MSDPTIPANLPAWHPLKATTKLHAHIEALKAQAHTSTTVRNREREDRLAKLRQSEAGPPQ